MGGKDKIQTKIRTKYVLLMELVHQNKLFNLRATNDDSVACA